MRELGAEIVLDYRSPTVVSDMVAAINGRKVAGILAVGTGSAELAVSLATMTGARHVALASPSVSFGSLPRRAGVSVAFLRTITRLVASNVALQITARRRGIRARYVWGSTLMTNEVGPMLWGDYLPSALADGRHVCAPRPQVVGDGLESIQAAIDLVHAGASARKFVVRL